VSDPAQDGDGGAENSPADRLDDGHPPLTTEKGDTVEDLGNFVDAIRKRLSNLEDEVEEVQEELNEERQERQRLEEENEELREEIERLDARTDLLRLVQNSDEMDAETRQAALIQNLKEAAEKQRERGREPKASLSPEEAEAALGHPHKDDTLIYKDMKRAVDLLGNEDVLWYDSAGYGETRLKMDLSEGSISGSITGRV